MIKKIVLATSNPHKLKEIQSIAKNFDVEFILVEGDFNPVEDGKTYEENSYIKAKEAAKLMGLPALADDTGLEVEALNNEPGLYSARYAPTNEEKISKILTKLSGIKNRKAKFVCSMVLTEPNGEILHTSRGKINGEIITETKGIHGFGYDPIFLVNKLNKTLAELTTEEKNAISHRAIALTNMLNFIKNKNNNF